MYLQPLVLLANVSGYVHPTSKFIPGMQIQFFLQTMKGCVTCAFVKNKIIEWC